MASIASSNARRFLDGSNPPMVGLATKNWRGIADGPLSGDRRDCPNIRSEGAKQTS